MNIKDLVAELKELSTSELSEVSTSLAKKIGIDLTKSLITNKSNLVEPVLFADTKSTFTVILASFVSDKKIGVIKVLREIKSGTGLAEAKSLVESTPKVILENISKEEAESVKQRLENAGAKILLE